MDVRVSGIKFKRKPDTEGYFKIQKALKTAGAFKDVSLKELAWYIGEGHSVILAKYKKVAEAISSISREYIESLQLMTLDIETEKVDIVDEVTGEILGKEFFADPLPTEDIEFIIYRKYGIKPIIKYNTFNHTEDDPRARLIYYIHRPVTVMEYESMLTAILHDEELKGRIDKQCKNANRLWQGTDKEVRIRKDYKPIDEDLIQRLLNTYENIKPQIQANRSQITYTGRKGAIIDLADRVKVKSEYRMVVKDLINTSVNVVEFLQSHFGLQLNRHCNLNQNIINCRCPIHNGHNEKGFAIFQNTNSCCCFGDCDRSFDIMQLGYYYYGEFNFNKIALTIIDEYNLSIDERWVEIL